MVCSVGACASAAGDGSGAGGANGAATTPGVTTTTADMLLPAGFGTLRQDEITVSIRSGALLVKVTPLDEALIRLLAPDTYDRLSSLRRSRSEEWRQILTRLENERGQIRSRIR